MQNAEDFSNAVSVWVGPEGGRVSKQYAYLQIENCVPKTRYKDKSM
jgi:hypothetical protein